ncbi:hypothetical protein KY349_02015 [Candidatus Woesearchaeota archaeon]|nr:hypothetical protein [Candidatus Woesearchaeota archaeon]
MKKAIFFIIVLVLAYSVNAEDIWQMDQAERSETIKNNLDEVNLDQVPGMLKFLLGKPKINIEVNGEVYGFKIAGNRIKDFVEGGIKNPHYIIFIPEDVLNEVVNSDDIPGAVEDAYSSGRITIEPQMTGAKIKFWFAERLLDWFAPEE